MKNFLAKLTLFIDTLWGKWKTFFTLMATLALLTGTLWGIWKTASVTDLTDLWLLLIPLALLALTAGIAWYLSDKKAKEEEQRKKEKAAHVAENTEHAKVPKAEPKATEEKKGPEKETEGASLAGKIFGGFIALLVVGLTLYFLNSKGWLTFDNVTEHWFLAILIACALLYVVYACITRTSAAWAGLIILLGIGATYYMIEHSGHSKHTAQGSNGPTPAVVVQSARSGSEHWQPLEVPGDGEWHAIEIPRGEKIRSMKCPADANMMVEGPNVPGGRDALDCADGKTFNLPEQAFWGATISFQAKYDATLVKVLFVSK